MSRIYQVFGPTGTAKSWFAIHAPKSKWYAELDPGSFDRGGGKTVTGVEFHEYELPLTALEDWGIMDFSTVGQSGKGAVQIAHRYTGWAELYGQFLEDYLTFIKGPLEMGVIDTSTLLWDMAQNALRQRIQQEGGSIEYQSDRLKRLEYQEPNNQMVSILKGAKRFGKDLILIAHRGEVWFNDKPTGKWKPDGWSKAMDESDVSLMFEVRNKKPVATTFKVGGADLAIVDRVIEEPTFEKVEAIVDAARKLRELGIDPPESNDELVELAAAY